jgi:hypothetical protein
LGSEPRRGGGGGLLALFTCALDGALALGTFSALRARRLEACVAGPGMPISVFFPSIRIDPDDGWLGEDPGGGGGGGAAAVVLSADFFPSPSKMSRSDPPPLSSLDIRFSCSSMIRPVLLLLRDASDALDCE